MANALGGALGIQQYVLLFLWGVLLWGVYREVRDFIGMPQRGEDAAASRPPTPLRRAARPRPGGGGWFPCRMRKEKRSRSPERKGFLRTDPFANQRFLRL